VISAEQGLRSTLVDPGESPRQRSLLHRRYSTLAHLNQRNSTLSPRFVFPRRCSSSLPGRVHPKIGNLVSIDTPSIKYVIAVTGHSVRYFVLSQTAVNYLGRDNSNAADFRFERRIRSFGAGARNIVDPFKCTTNSY
jgi:hypothetical protein